MQLVGCFENGILGGLDAIWKGVGCLVGLEGERGQSVSRKMVVDLIGVGGNDGCELYYPTGTGRHRKRSISLAGTSQINIRNVR